MRNNYIRNQEQFDESWAWRLRLAGWQWTSARRVDDKLFKSPLTRGIAFEKRNVLGTDSVAKIIIRPECVFCIRSSEALGLYEVGPFPKCPGKVGMVEVCIPSLAGNEAGMLKISPCKSCVFNGGV